MELQKPLGHLKYTLRTIEQSLWYNQQMVKSYESGQYPPHEDAQHELKMRKRMIKENEKMIEQYSNAVEILEKHTK